MKNSSFSSPFSRNSMYKSPRTLEISGCLQVKGNKSPYAQDRFISPARRTIKAKENNALNHDIETTKMNCRATPGTPTHAKNPPKVTTKMLDAPGILKEFPSKLIDMNENSVLAVALETCVYLWEENNNVLLMDGIVPINGVCWVGDDLAISGDGHIELWDVKNAEVIQEYNDHDSRAAALSSYGFNKFATGGDDGLIYIYDKRISSINSYKIRAHYGEVCALGWSPDGNYIASGGADGNAFIFDGKKKIEIHHDAPVNSLAWINSGTLVTGEKGGVGKMHYRHIKSNDHKSVITESSISGMCYTEKWGLLVSHDDQSSTWDIWSNDLNKKIANYQHCNGQEIIEITANVNGSLVATLSADETLQIWELEKQVNTPTQGVRLVPNQLPSPRFNTTTNNRNGLSSFQKSSGFSDFR